MLQTWVWGYYAALGMHGITEPVPEMASHFGAWLHTVTGWSMSCGWARAIAEHARGRANLDVFFEYADRFRRLRPKVMRTARVPRQGTRIGGADEPRATQVQIVRYVPSRLHFLRVCSGRQWWDDRIVYDDRGTYETTLREAMRQAQRKFRVEAADWTKPERNRR